MKPKFVLVAIAILIFFAPTLALAEGEVTIYRKDGAKVEGKLLDFGERSYRVQLADGRVVEVPESEVEKLVFKGEEGGGAAKTDLAFEAKVRELIPKLADERELMAFLGQAPDDYEPVAPKLEALGEGVYPILAQALLERVQAADYLLGREQDFPEEAERMVADSQVFASLAELLVRGGKGVAAFELGLGRVKTDDGRFILAVCLAVSGDAGRERLRAMVGPDLDADKRRAAAWALALCRESAGAEWLIGDLGEPGSRRELNAGWGQFFNL